MKIFQYLLLALMLSACVNENQFGIINDPILAPGDEIDVIDYGNDQVRIKLKYLKEYLSVRKMHLAIFFAFIILSMMMMHGMVGQENL